MVFMCVLILYALICTYGWTGSNLQIFSIMMLGMAFWTPLGKIFNMGGEFKRYEGVCIV
jgi:hypothetical protein